MKDQELNVSNERTEEVQMIIERMPTNFGLWVTMIVALIFMLVFIFGWIIRYPDVVSGQIVINANASPIKLVSNSYGKLKLYGIKSMDNVKEGQIIAYLENSTNLESVIFIDSLLKSYNPNSINIIDIQSKFPRNLSMGELNLKYYSLISSIQQLSNYKYDKIYDKQTESLIELLNGQQKAITTTTKRVEMAKNTLKYAHKFYERDSTLFTKRVISESELDKTQVNYLSGKDAYQNSINNLINSKQSAQQTQSKIQDLSIQKPEKEKELRIAVISAYNDLEDNIKSWEQKYVFKSPLNGKVQFLKFYTNNQFIQSGEQVFSIVPKEEKAFGQVNLPAMGSGKLKIGQEVLVKLDNFPYLEYGSISGRVNSISLTTSTTKNDKNEVETYMVVVDFPNQLKTNYGAKLNFKAEARGTAEIITNDRRLIMRLFDNLKYATNK